MRSQLTSRPRAVLIGAALVATAPLGACFLPEPEPEPAILIDPSSWDFGSIPVQTHQTPSQGTKSFTITNNGDEEISVHPLANGPTLAFRISSNLCGSPLAPGGSCTVTVSFGSGSPTTHTGTLSVPIGSIDAPAAATAALSGTTFAPT